MSNANSNLAVGLSGKTDGELYDRHEKARLANPPLPPPPSLCGIPLKYLSLATLAVQNSTLTIIMHYSRVSSSPSRTYSAATAVLVNELLKGFISFIIAFYRIDMPASRSLDAPQGPFASQLRTFLLRLKRLCSEILSQDCWKLSIPAVLYVIQNHLQFIAISNLEAATFQVSYQLKILTTAAFSVLLLRKKLFTTQWLALFLLAVGVGVVQIQFNIGGAVTVPSRVVDTHSMNRINGFIAVIAACCTSGLAGVYFEMVLKGSPGDVWVRNVQLSLFSLLPALSPIMFAYAESNNGVKPWAFTSLFDNFGPWAWATVATQVVGGLVTAMVIKYADNILKGFATSLSIVISSLASVALFHFIITFTFLLGSLTVLLATWLYNQPQKSGGTDEVGMARRRGMAFASCGCDDMIPMSSLSHSFDDSELAWEQDEGSQSSRSFSSSRCSSSV